MAMGRPRAFDTETAVEAAMDVFWRLGYEGASMAELTRAMGINAPSLYATFGSKEGLFRTALEHYEKVRLEFLQTISVTPTARAAAEILLCESANRFNSPGRPKGCLFVQGGLAVGTAHEHIAQILASRRRDVEALMRERFERAQAEGDLPVSASPEDLARFMAMVTDGMAVQSATGATREQLLTLAQMALRLFPT